MPEEAIAFMTLRIFAFLTALAVVPTAMAQSNTPQEAKNLKLGLDWKREVVLGGHMDKASKYMAADYVEHNANVSKQIGRAHV